MKLPNVANDTISKGRGLPGIEFCHVGRGAVYSACGRGIKGTKDVQKGALSCPRLPHHGNQFSGLDLEIEIAKKCERPARGLVRLFQSLNQNDRFANRGRIPQLSFPLKAGGLPGSR